MGNVVAKIHNQPILDIPKGLYISPEALLIFLDIFEGPLDLLLYLIKKRNIDILNVPIAQIADQYISYINAMTILNLDLASEYLAMAATLVSIKSRIMLPESLKNIEEPQDILNSPKNELISKLIEYEKIKIASQNLNNIPQVDRDYRWVNIEISFDKILPIVEIKDLKIAWQPIFLQRNSIKKNNSYQIVKQKLSIQEFIADVLKKLQLARSSSFSSLLAGNFSVAHIVVNLIAILELAKKGLITIEANGLDSMLTSNHTPLMH